MQKQAEVPEERKWHHLLGSRRLFESTCRGICNFLWLALGNLIFAFLLWTFVYILEWLTGEKLPDWVSGVSKFLGNCVLCVSLVMFAFFSFKDLKELLYEEMGWLQKSDVAEESKGADDVSNKIESAETVQNPISG